MYKTINVDDCEKVKDEDEGVTEGKEWILTKDGRRALFKPNQDKYKYSHICEKVTYELAKILGIPCAETEIAERNGKLGILSYDFLEDGDDFSDGNRIIVNSNGNHNMNITKESLEYLNKNGYSIKLIIGLLKKMEIEEEGINMMMLDSLTGHSDRHRGNWGIIRKSSNKDARLAPMFDNSATFNLNLNHRNIKGFLKTKRKNYESYESKILKLGKSKIYVNESTEKAYRGVAYSRVMEYIFTKHPKESSDFIENMKEKITDDEIGKIVAGVSGYMEDDYSVFLEDYIKIRRDNLTLEHEKYIKHNEVDFINIFQNNISIAVNLINYDRSTTEKPVINPYIKKGNEIIIEENNDLSLRGLDLKKYKLNLYKKSDFSNIKKILNFKNKAGDFNEGL